LDGFRSETKKTARTHTQTSNTFQPISLNTAAIQLSWPADNIIDSKKMGERTQNFSG
jgi:hypothetical protein